MHNQLDSAMGSQARADVSIAADGGRSVPSANQSGVRGLISNCAEVLRREQPAESGVRLRSELPHVEFAEPALLHLQRAAVDRPEWRLVKAGFRWFLVGVLMWFVYDDPCHLGLRFFPGFLTFFAVVPPVRHVMNCVPGPSV